ncbi:conjugal transfer protein TrbF [Asticcacaulis excentricus]|uniref:Conjugal transfer protein TrbF n=1 Tax=Asticcacaulis excentricus (strain ATCC 15261 / DSM 4724 / KCTC 12464 / NCIMB 9791 / VKM B-1370 / CB 48) TaxID=573065 RepID=E8RUT8_ASTEC|nr:conjugal transfer protein TrbF [Asticcacaulis excentricus]ADU14138.1 conjugal transfer protein TrbF [Asticcacaulis excentricus CB 48]
MRFKRPVQRYGDRPEPETPYQKAAQIWDERIGTSQAQAANWRLMALGASVVSLCLAGGMIWLASQSRVTPYVVEVDSQGGVRAVAPAVETYQPTDAQVAWFLARFITNVRSLSIDPVLVRQNWLEAYAFATDRAAQALNAQAQANDPFAGIGERSVTVSILSVVRASPKSFQIKWKEQVYSRGLPDKTTYWTGILNVQKSLPRREDVLRKNPLGLYVTDLSWSQDYSSPEVKPSVTAVTTSPSEGVQP